MRKKNTFLFFDQDISYQKTPEYLRILTLEYRNMIFDREKLEIKNKKEFITRLKTKLNSKKKL